MRHLIRVSVERERGAASELVESPPLGVRPVEREPEEAGPLAGELPRVEQRDELDVLRLRRRLDPLEQRREREADPGDDHGPSLDAAERVDALLDGEEPEQLVDVVRLRLVQSAVPPG